jgi:hypothetical protein
MAFAAYPGAMRRARLDLCRKRTVRGTEFYQLLERLIGASEAERCLSRICRLNELEERFHDQITNTEALAFYVYSTANGWHSYINEQLWSDTPDPEVLAFTEVLNSGLLKLAPIRGKNATVFRGYTTRDLGAFATRYVENEIVTFPAFTSASFKEAGAFGGNVLFIIRALSARAIWFLSPNFHEEEALLPSGCRFRVADKEFQAAEGQNAKLVIILQEIETEP